MQTQIKCPQCGTPFTADIYQVVDVDQEPQLKQLLLAGQLNVAVCPACGAGGQLSTPLIYHDSEHELFMVHVPTEVHMNTMEREQMIGRLTRQVVDNLAPEKRKAYLFQPQTILNMQTFMEKVLETEGITKEMIDRQRKQSELLNTMLRADKDVIDHLLKERTDEIDETFFAMVQAYLEAAQQMQDERQLVKLTNLRARLMTETPVGRRMEKQQMALHGLNRAAKKQGGLTPALLLEHLLQHLGDDAIVSGLVSAGQSALNYEFFTLLSKELEKTEKRGQKGRAAQLQALRQELLEVQAAMQQQSQQLVEEAMGTLATLLAAPDKKAAIRQHADQLDDAFMYILSASMAQAESRRDRDRLQALTELQNLIVAEIESQYPPEVLLLNQLLEADTRQQREQLLDENARLVQPNLIQMLSAVENQVKEMGQSELNGRLQEVRALIQARL